MKPPGITQYQVDYAYYRDKQAAQQSTSPTATPAKQAATTGTLDKKELRRQRAQARKVVAAETRELRSTIRRSERQIETFETEQAKLVEQMADPDANLDFAEAGRRLQVIQSELAEYTRRWETASEALEELERQ